MGSALIRTYQEPYIELLRHSRSYLVKIASYIAAIIGGMVIGYLGVSIGIVDIWDGIPGTQEEPHISLPTYLSFVSVMLTGVTAILAAIAIFIGIVAAFTFAELSQKAEQAAQKRADEALSDEVVSARIAEITFRHMRFRSVDELEKGFDPSDTGER